jgi:uncharacterized membrane protein
MCRIVPAVACLAASVQCVQAQEFYGVGIIPYGWSSYATGVSGDGSVVVGAVYSPTGGSDGLGGYIAMKWTKAGGRVLLGLLEQGDSSWAYGASGDGAIISGEACDQECTSVQPFRWIDPGPIEPLGYMPGSSYSCGLGISDDGSTIAGYAVQDGTYDVYPTFWREGLGVVQMSRFPGGGTAIAHTASADGAFLAGRGFDVDRRQQAARWSDGGTIQGLGFLADPGPITYSIGRGITPEGAMVVGTAHGADGEGGYAYQGFRWTPAAGMQGLGVSGPRGSLGSTAAMDVSANGRTIVGAWGGETGFGDGSQAALWMAGIGWRDLETYLVNDLDLENVAAWTLVEALGVSNDGSVIVGWGYDPGGYTEGFVVVLPVECPADFNGDGEVNTLDVLAFLNAWSAGDPSADFNADGVINTLDVLAFLNAWGAGC